MNENPYAAPAANLGTPVHPERVSVPSWYVFLPLLMYCVSFALPLGEVNQNEYWWGFSIFIFSMVWWPIGWLANVTFAFALWQLSRGHWYAARIISGIGVGLALTCLQFALTVARGPFDLAYWVWLGAQALVLVSTFRIERDLNSLREQQIYSSQSR